MKRSNKESDQQIESIEKDNEINLNDKIWSSIIIILYDWIAFPFVNGLFFGAWNYTRRLYNEKKLILFKRI